MSYAITILVTNCPRGTWRQYQIISDERCVIVEMVPAILAGWKFHRINVQGSVDWPGRNMDAIVAWKLDGRVDAYAPRRAEIGAEFRAMLVATAVSGTLPVSEAE